MDEAKPDQKADEAKSEFEKHGLTVAMYIVYNQNEDSYGVIGAPGFMDDKHRAYFALWMAEKELDKFYAKRESVRNRIVQGAMNFRDKMNLKNFLSRKH